MFTVPAPATRQVAPLLRKKAQEVAPELVDITRVKFLKGGLAAWKAKGISSGALRQDLSTWTPALRRVARRDPQKRMLVRSFFYAFSPLLAVDCLPQCSGADGYRHTDCRAEEDGWLFPACIGRPGRASCCSRFRPSIRISSTSINCPTALARMICSSTGDRLGKQQVVVHFMRSGNKVLLIEPNLEFPLILMRIAAEQATVNAILCRIGAVRVQSRSGAGGRPCAGGCH